MTIRILLIDDHALFRTGIRLLLQRQPDFEVVDEASELRRLRVTTSGDISNHSKGDITKNP